MKNKKVFYFCVIQTLFIVFILVWIAFSSVSPLEVKEVDLVEYLEQFSEENNFTIGDGYISNAKSAKIIGSTIIDQLTGQSSFGYTTVEYDSEHRLWCIRKGYLFHNGGLVVIEQDSGRVIKALLSK